MTLHDMLIEATNECPPALQGDRRAGFILGFLISRECPDTRQELFKACYGVTWDEAVEQLKGAFNAD